MITANNILKKIPFIFILMNSVFCFGQDSNSKKVDLNYKMALTAVNDVFLKKLFVNNYYNNTEYFINTDLSKEDPIDDIAKANILLQSMQLTVTGDSLFVCTKGLNFNENYRKLYEIRNSNILKNKYNKANIDQAIVSIDKLPILAHDSKLEKTKTKIKNLLSSYRIKNEELMQDLEKLKKPDQDNPAVKKEYLLLVKKYLEYPYLVRIIQESRNGKNTYKTDLNINFESN